jgi:hypothetical protein
MINPYFSATVTPFEVGVFASTNGQTFMAPGANVIKLFCP